MTPKPLVIYVPCSMKVNRVTGNAVAVTIHEGNSRWPEYAAYEARIDPPVEVDAGFVAVEWTSPSSATIRAASRDEIASARAGSIPALTDPGRLGFCR